MLKSKEGKASNSIILERRILKSVLYGHWSAGYAKQNCEDLKELAKEFEDNHWGFIADMLELGNTRCRDIKCIFWILKNYMMLVVGQWLL